MWTKAILISTMMVALNSCGLSAHSEVEALDYASFDTSAVTGTWRFTAAYSFSPGDVSGVTASIIKGRNPTSDFLGLPECDLTVQSADSDYQALRLPGLNGKYFNPCAFVGVIQHYLPPNGQGTVSKQFATGGSIDVFYNGNRFTGFKSNSEMGNMELRIGGSAGNQNFGGIPSASQRSYDGFSGGQQPVSSGFGVDPYSSQGVNGYGNTSFGNGINGEGGNSGSVIPSEPEEFVGLYPTAEG